jgi:hypothetical protein
MGGTRKRRIDAVVVPVAFVASVDSSGPGVIDKEGSSAMYGVATVVVAMGESGSSTAVEIEVLGCVSDTNVGSAAGRS